MDPLEFESNKLQLKGELEEELRAKAKAVLQHLVLEVMSDPRTVTASILGLDVIELLKEVINQQLTEFTKEE